MTFAILVLALLGGIVYLKFKNIKLQEKHFKIFSLVLAVIFFFRFMLGDDSLRQIHALANSPIDSPFLTTLSLIFNWAFYSVVLLLILFPFFKSSKLRVLVKYYGTAVSLICAVLISFLTVGIVGEDAYRSFNIRVILMAFEIAIALAYCIYILIEDGFKSEKKDLWGLLCIIPMLLATMPPYMLQSLFGYVDYLISVKDLNTPHRALLYLSVLLPLLMYFIMRKNPKETNRGILIYICLGTLLSFSVDFKFATFADVTSWPFHLCNTAMYILPLCLIFRWKKLFYFTYFINVLGAFLAMVMPNYSSVANLFSPDLVRFYINHFIAFFMPLLIVMLRIFERPKLREFKWSMIAFGIYFLLVLILNAWFSNYGDVDYFFINSDFIADKLGAWAESLLDITLAFNIGSLSFTFFPVYQAAFFIAYVGLGALMWFIYEAMYSFEDTVLDIANRKQKIKADQLALEVSMGGRSKEEPMNLDGENKIILRNFTKRYGTSDVYAVKDANLEIVGGEIFGFLGHNGAGKSTIIKSIVGIQPITEGNIEVCGYDVDMQPVMAKRCIGFVPDHYALYEKLTGREYINYIADLYDVSQEDRTKAIDKYVSLFELGDAFDNQIKTYSHGMKQKITIMSALVHNPKVWILDEPLTGLDPTSIFQVKECMKQHAKEGNIVFFSSHIIDVVEQLCDKIAIIKKGQILASKYLSELEQEGTSLEEFYLKLTNTDVSAVKVKEEQNPQQEQIPEQVEKSKKKNCKLKNLFKRKKQKIESEEISINENQEETSINPENQEQDGENHNDDKS